MSDPKDWPRKFCVARIGENGKILEVLPGELLFEGAKALARENTKKYQPVSVSHIDWLKEQGRIA